MNGDRSQRRGGGNPLDDVVHWFQDWLGKRRESLSSGGSLPRADLRPSAQEVSSVVFSRGIGAVSGDAFDRAFRAVVSAGSGSGAATAEAPPPRRRASSTDWSRAPKLDMDRQAFAKWLESWFHESELETVGGVGEYVRRPWLRVSIGATRCHLNANTTRAGIAEYLALVKAEGPGLPWYVVPSRRGVLNEIAVGKDRVRIRGFHLFTDSVFRQAGLIGGARENAGRRDVSAA